MATTGASTQGTRKVAFAVTSEKDFKFTITITVASKLTKLEVVTR